MTSLQILSHISNKVPFFKEAKEFIEMGIIPEGDYNNLNFCKKYIKVHPEVKEDDLMLLCDAQTSGGILVAVPPEKKEIFIAQRNDLNGVWQFPQGGIDNGEEVQEALFREMEEEIGTSKAKIVAEYPEWISYDFPSKIAKKMKPYKGQTQRYFLVKLKKKAKIDIKTKQIYTMLYIQKP